MLWYIMVVLQRRKLQANSCHLVLMAFQCFKLVFESKYINAHLSFWLFGNYWFFFPLMIWMQWFDFHGRGLRMVWQSKYNTIFFPHYEGIHCMSHCTNLVVTLFHLLVVFCNESLLQSIYMFSFFIVPSDT